MKILRVFNLLAAVALVFSLVVSVRPAAAETSPPPRPPQSAQYVPGEVVVGFVSGQSEEVYAQRARGLASMANGRLAAQQGGTALLSFPENADVHALASQLSAMRGVAYAEPNYIFANPAPLSTAQYFAGEFNTTNILRRSVAAALVASPLDRGRTSPAALETRSLNAPTANAQFTVLSIESLRAMRRKTAGGIIKAVYPNDPDAFFGGAWDWVGASIVWPNTTASAGICEIDTGVDYLHPDLKYRVIKGYDFVNNDTDPMDDNGHGTHVAGIMVANQNNKIGIAGVSTGKLVAVKALDAQGFGTNFDVAAAITSCANRTDVRVINMSLGGPDTTALKSAVNFAVNGAPSPKLIVAAAGNDGTDVTTFAFPAAYATSVTPNFIDKVVSVGASGYWYQPDPVNDPATWVMDWSCRAGWFDDDTDTPYHFSNYGSWVNVVAPGQGIMSTTPWDKPFWMNSFLGVSTRYAPLDGTSMAAPYVAATAARRWGLKSTDTNDLIGLAVRQGRDVVPNYTSGWWDLDITDYSLDPDPGTAELGQCWPASMAGKHDVNVAAALERGATTAEAYDARTGYGLTGATASAIRIDFAPTPDVVTTAGTAVINPITWKASPLEADPTRIYAQYPGWTDIINLPIDKTTGSPYACPANYSTLTYGKISKSGYTATAQWMGFLDCIAPGVVGYLGIIGVPPASPNFDVVAAWFGLDAVAQHPWDLDTLVYLPECVSAPCGTQLDNFLIGSKYGNDYGEREGDTLGVMTAFPFARLKRDGGLSYDKWIRIEDITIRNRSVAHDALATNAALPYFAGTYTVQMTDYAETADGADAAELGGADPKDPWPWVFVWKDGVIKFDSWLDCTYASSNHFWQAVTIFSSSSGSVVYDDSSGTACGSSLYGPYP